MSNLVLVTEILSDTLITVSCESGACSGCKGAGFCNAKRRTFTAWNKDKLAIQAGDTVDLYLPQARTIGATLFTLILPLLFFPLGYLLAQVLGFGEGLSFLVALSSIGLGFLFVKLFFATRQQAYMPLVVEVIPSE